MNVITPDIIRRLGALGLSVEQVAGVLEIIDSEPAPSSSPARPPEAAPEVSPGPGAATVPDPETALRQLNSLVMGREEPGTVVNWPTRTGPPPEPTFETFWRIMPKKAGKKVARVAWDRLIDKGVRPADIVAAADNALDRDLRAVNPATFLNALLKSGAVKPEEHEQGEPDHGHD